MAAAKEFFQIFPVVWGMRPSWSSLKKNSAIHSKEGSYHWTCPSIGLPSISRFTGFVRRALRFRRLLAEERPNVVISFMGEANLINALLSHRPLLTVHNHMTAFSGMRGRVESFFVRILNKALYRRATVVAVSQSIKSRFS